MAELTHRVTVGLSTQGTVETHTGCGVLVAPGWVLTLADVLGEPGEVVVTLHDGRRLPGQVVHIPAGLRDPLPALVRLTDGVDHDCAWLGDPQPPPAEALVQGVRALPARLERWSGRGRVLGSGPVFRVEGIETPAVAAGGPVVDLERGTFVGLTWGRVGERPGESVYVSVTDLCAVFKHRLWQEVMRAHDAYHLRRLDDVAPDEPTWTSVQFRHGQGGTGQTGTGREGAQPGGTEREGTRQGGAQQGGIGQEEFTPQLRTRLYGILAALDQPFGLAEARGLLAQVDPDASGSPYTWRDVTWLLAARGHGLGGFALLAARIWSSRVGSGHAADHPAVVALRAWLDETAHTRLVGDARDRVLKVLGNGRRLACADVFVETVQAPSGGHGWRVSRREGDVLRTVKESTGGWAAPLEAYKHSEFEAAVRFSEAYGERAHVVFVVPPAVLDEPFEDWPPIQGPWSGLGERCHVSVALEREGPLHQDGEASRRFRWAGVANGPLRPLPLTHETGRSDTENELMFAHLAAVPVHCGSLSHGVGAEYRDALAAHGYGVALWRRSRFHADCAEFHVRAAELVRTAGSVGGLLEQVRALRARQGDADTAWACGLVVQYDPPLGHSLH